MTNLYIDLETLKCTNKDRIEYITTHMKAPGNYKTEIAINKWMSENKQKTIDNTVFDGASGSICTIGYAFDNDKITILQRNNSNSEADIIQDFFNNLKTYSESVNIAPRLLDIKWIAHNASFDLPFLFKRCVILGINTHGIRIPHNDRHGSKHVFCTMIEWMGFGVKAGGSMDNICNALGMEGKRGFDGSMVDEAFRNEEYTRIAEYCKDDVRKLRYMHKRMTFSDVL